MASILDEIFPGDIAQYKYVIANSYIINFFADDSWVLHFAKIILYARTRQYS